MDWAHSLEAGGVKIGQHFRPERNRYWVEEAAERPLGVAALIEPYDRLIFEEELRAWHRLEKDSDTRGFCHFPSVV